MAARMLVCPGPGCGRTFEGKTAASKYCSSNCRVKAHKQPGGSAAVPAAKPAERSPRRRRAQLASTTRRELAKARRLSSSWGELALILAEEIDQGGNAGAAKAALAREYATAMERALRDSKADDPVQGIIDRADAKVAKLDEVGEQRERRATRRPG